MAGRAMRRRATNRRLPVWLGSCYAFTGTTAREGGARSSETPIRRLNLKHMLPQTWSKTRYCVTYWRRGGGSLISPGSLTIPLDGRTKALMQLEMFPWKTLRAGVGHGLL